MIVAGPPSRSPPASAHFKLYQGVLEGRVGGLHELSSMRRYPGFSNEVLSFEIEDGQVEPFLTVRGFSRVHNVTGADLHERYFKDKNARRKVNTGYAIATAVA